MGGSFKPQAHGPATSPRRIPGARALYPRLLGLLRGCPPPAAARPTRPGGGRGAPRSVAARARPHTLGDLGGSIHRAVRGRRDAEGGERIRPRARPTPRRRGWAGAPGWGSAELGAASGAAGGRLRRLQSLRSQLGAPRRSLWPAGPLRPPVATPAPAPSLAPRAFLGRHLFATRSLLRRFASERVNIPPLGFPLASNLRRSASARPRP